MTQDISNNNNANQVANAGPSSNGGSVGIISPNERQSTVNAESTPDNPNASVVYGDKSISLSKPERGSVFVYPRPGDTIRVLGDPRNIKFSIDNGDITIRYEDGTSYTVANAAVMALSADEAANFVIGGKSVSALELAGPSSGFASPDDVLVIVRPPISAESTTAPGDVLATAGSTTVGEIYDGENTTGRTPFTFPEQPIVEELLYSIKSLAYDSNQLYSVTVPYVSDILNRLDYNYNGVGPIFIVTGYKFSSNLFFGIQADEQGGPLTTNPSAVAPPYSITVKQGGGWDPDPLVQLQATNLNRYIGSQYYNNITVYGKSADEFGRTTISRRVLISATDVVSGIDTITLSGMPKGVNIVALDKDGVSNPNITISQSGTRWTVTSKINVNAISLLITYPEGLPEYTGTLGIVIAAHYPGVNKIYDGRSRIPIKFGPVSTPDDIMGNGWTFATNTQGIDVTTGYGSDVVYAPIGLNVITTNGGDDVVYTADGVDNVTVGLTPGADMSIVYQSLGNDIIIFKSYGKTSLVNAANYEVSKYDISYYLSLNEGEGVTYSFGDASGITDLFFMKSATEYDRITGLAYIQGTAYADRFTVYSTISNLGNGVSPVLDGVSGNDVIYLGFAGSIYLNDGTIEGVSHTISKIPTYNGIPVSDNFGSIVIGSSNPSASNTLYFTNIDVIYGSSSNDTIYGGMGNNMRIYGNGGSDTLYYSYLLPSGITLYNLSTNVSNTFYVNSPSMMMGGSEYFYDISTVYLNDTENTLYLSNFGSLTVYASSNPRTSDAIDYGTYSQAGLTFTFGTTSGFSSIFVTKTNGATDAIYRLSTSSTITATSYDDTFIVKGAGINIDGRGGNNTLDYTDSGNPIEVDLNNRTVNRVGGPDTFENIQIIYGSSGGFNTFLSGISETSLRYTLYGAMGVTDPANPNKFDTLSYASSLDSNNYVVINMSAYTATTYFLDQFGAYQEQFNYFYGNFANFVGSAGDDVFMVSKNFMYGNINGGGGNNSLSYASYEATSGRNGATISSGLSFGSINILNIQNITGSLYNDTFYTDDVSQTILNGGGFYYNSGTSYSAAGAPNVRTPADIGFGNTFDLSSIVSVVTLYTNSTSSGVFDEANPTPRKQNNAYVGTIMRGGVSQDYYNMQNVILTLQSDHVYDFAGVSNRFDGNGGSNTLDYRLLTTATGSSNVYITIDFASDMGYGTVTKGASSLSQYQTKFRSFSVFYGTTNADTYILSATQSSLVTIYSGDTGGKDIVSFANFGPQFSISLDTQIISRGYNLFGMTGIIMSTGQNTAYFGSGESFNVDYAMGTSLQVADYYALQQFNVGTPGFSTDNFYAVFDIGSRSGSSYVNTQKISVLGVVLNTDYLTRSNYIIGTQYADIFFVDLVNSSSILAGVNFTINGGVAYADGQSDSLYFWPKSLAPSSAGATIVDSSINSFYLSGSSNSLKFVNINNFYFGNLATVNPAQNIFYSSQSATATAADTGVTDNSIINVDLGATYTNNLFSFIKWNRGIGSVSSPQDMNDLTGTGLENDLRLKYIVKDTSLGIVEFTDYEDNIYAFNDIQRGVGVTRGITYYLDSIAAAASSNILNSISYAKLGDSTKPQDGISVYASSTIGSFTVYRNWTNTVDARAIDYIYSATSIYGTAYADSFTLLASGNMYIDFAGNTNSIIDATDVFFDRVSYNSFNVGINIKTNRTTGIATVSKANGVDSLYNVQLIYATQGSDRLYLSKEMQTIYVDFGNVVNSSAQDSVDGTQVETGYRAVFYLGYGVNWTRGPSNPTVLPYYTIRGWQYVQLQEISSSNVQSTAYFRGANNIAGTPGNDVIYGTTASSDPRSSLVTNGRGVNYIINGNGGQDTIYYVANDLTNDALTFVTSTSTVYKGGGANYTTYAYDTLGLSGATGSNTIYLLTKNNTVYLGAAPLPYTIYAGISEDSVTSVSYTSNISSGINNIQGSGGGTGVSPVYGTVTNAGTPFADNFYAQSSISLTYVVDGAGGLNSLFYAYIPNGEVNSVYNDTSTTPVTTFTGFNWNYAIKFDLASSNPVKIITIYNTTGGTISAGSSTNRYDSVTNISNFVGSQGQDVFYVSSDNPQTYYFNGGMGLAARPAGSPASWQMFSDNLYYNMGDAVYFTNMKPTDTRGIQVEFVATQVFGITDPRSAAYGGGGAQIYDYIVYSTAGLTYAVNLFHIYGTEYSDFFIADDSFNKTIYIYGSVPGNVGIRNVSGNIETLSDVFSLSKLTSGSTAYFNGAVNTTSYILTNTGTYYLSYVSTIEGSSSNDVFYAGTSNLYKFTYVGLVGASYFLDYVFDGAGGTNTINYSGNFSAFISAGVSSAGNTARIINPATPGFTFYLDSGLVDKGTAYRDGGNLNVYDKISNFSVIYGTLGNDTFLNASGVAAYTIYGGTNGLASNDVLYYTTSNALAVNYSNTGNFTVYKPNGNYDSLFNFSSIYTSAGNDVIYLTSSDAVNVLNSGMSIYTGGGINSLYLSGTYNNTNPIKTQYIVWDLSLGGTFTVADDSGVVEVSNSNTAFTTVQEIVLPDTSATTGVNTVYFDDRNLGRITAISSYSTGNLSFEKYNGGGITLNLDYNNGKYGGVLNLSNKSVSFSNLLVNAGTNSGDTFGFAGLVNTKNYELIGGTGNNTASFLNTTVSTSYNFTGGWNKEGDGTVPRAGYSMVFFNKNLNTSTFGSAYAREFNMQVVNNNNLSSNNLWGGNDTATSSYIAISNFKNIVSADYNTIFRVTDATQSYNLQSALVTRWSQFTIANPTKQGNATAFVKDTTSSAYSRGYDGYRATADYSVLNNASGVNVGASAYITMTIGRDNYGAMTVSKSTSGAAGITGTDYLSGITNIYGLVTGTTNILDYGGTTYETIYVGGSIYTQSSSSYYIVNNTNNNITLGSVNSTDQSYFSINGGSVYGFTSLYLGGGINNLNVIDNGQSMDIYGTTGKDTVVLGYGTTLDISTFGIISSGFTFHNIDNITTVDPYSYYDSSNSFTTFSASRGFISRDTYTNISEVSGVYEITLDYTMGTRNTIDVVGSVYAYLDTISGDIKVGDTTFHTSNIAEYRLTSSDDYAVFNSNTNQTVYGDGGYDTAEFKTTDSLFVSQLSDKSFIVANSLNGTKVGLVEFSELKLGDGDDYLMLDANMLARSNLKIDGGGGDDTVVLRGTVSSDLGNHFTNIGLLDLSQVKNQQISLNTNQLEKMAGDDKTLNISVRDFDMLNLTESFGDTITETHNQDGSVTYLLEDSSTKGTYTVIVSKK